MATEQERQAYRKKLLALLAQGDQLDAAALRRVRALVRRLQRSVLNRIRTDYRAGRWGEFYLPHQIRAIEELVDGYVAQYGGLLHQYLPQSWGIGVARVDETLREVVPLLPRIDPKLVNVAAQFSADLIRGYRGHALEQINRQIRVAVVSGQPPQQLIDELAKRIDLRGTTFSSVAYRGEIIARTELSRVQELAFQSRLQQVTSLFPGLRLKKQYVVAHILEWPCSICQPYDGQVFEVADPQAPMPPLHPNCRCSYVPYVHGLSSGPVEATGAESPIRETLDGRLSLCLVKR